MKKGLNILGIIGLTSTSTTTLIGCEKSEKANNNENGKDNKPESKREPQQPPKDSNGKLIIDISNENLQKEINKKNNKGYIVIGKNKRYGHDIFKFNSKGNVLTISSNISFGNDNYFSLKDVKTIYRGDGNGEPQLPNIDKNTGEITDGKEQKGTE